MKGRIVTIAASALAVIALVLAFAPGVLAQTPNPQRGNGNGNANGVGPAAGNGAGVGNAYQGTGMMGRGGGGGMMGGYQNSLIAVAAHELGMTNTELVSALGGTKSIAQVAAEHNVAVTTIVDAFLAPRVENLNAAVAAGRITQAQADQMLATMRTNVTEQVNEVWAPRGAGPGTGAGTGYVDADGDGICDNMGTGGNGQGNGMMGQGRGPRR